MTNNQLYTCPCCGYRTRDEKEYGSYNICPICFWEDDATQVENPNIIGANKVTLKQAQKNFIEFGACELQMKGHVLTNRKGYEIDKSLELFGE